MNASRPAWSRSASCRPPGSTAEGQVPSGVDIARSSRSSWRRSAGLPSASTSARSRRCTPSSLADGRPSAAGTNVSTMAARVCSGEVMRGSLSRGRVRRRRAAPARDRGPARRGARGVPPTSYAPGTWVPRVATPPRLDPAPEPDPAPACRAARTAPRRPRAGTPPPSGPGRRGPCWGSRPAATPTAPRSTAAGPRSARTTAGWSRSSSPCSRAAPRTATRSWASSRSWGSRTERWTSARSTGRCATWSRPARCGRRGRPGRARRAATTSSPRPAGTRSTSGPR